MPIVELVEMYIRGTQVNYYFICKTKLWLFSRNICMEHESDLVKLGKLLHLEVFKREDKEIQIGRIAIDVVRKGDHLEIVEVKRSDKFEEAHKYQALYYLYYLKRLGIQAKARLVYPKKKKNIELSLNENIENKIKKILKEIEEICKDNMPKPELKSHCKSCAYFEFCFS